MTFVTFNMTKIAAIATTPIMMFLGVKKFFASLFCDEEPLLPLPVYSFTRCGDIPNVSPFTIISIVCIGGKFGNPAGRDFKTPSIISPTENCFTIVPPVAPVDVIDTAPFRIVYGSMKIYLAIRKSFELTCKDTKNLLVSGLFVFKNFSHRSLLEAGCPIAFDGRQLPAEGDFNY